MSKLNNIRIKNYELSEYIVKYKEEMYKNFSNFTRGIKQTFYIIMILLFCTNSHLAQNNVLLKHKIICDSIIETICKNCLGERVFFNEKKSFKIKSGTYSKTHIYEDSTLNNTSHFQNHLNVYTYDYKINKTILYSINFIIDDFGKFKNDSSSAKSIRFIKYVEEFEIYQEYKNIVTLTTDLDVKLKKYFLSLHIDIDGKYFWVLRQKKYSKKTKAYFFDVNTNKLEKVLTINEWLIEFGP